MDNRMDAVELCVGSLEGTVSKILESMEAFHAEFREFTKKKRVEGYDEGETSPERSAITSPRAKSGNYEPHLRSGRRKLEIPVFNGDNAYGWLV